MAKRKPDDYERIWAVEIRGHSKSEKDWEYTQCKEADLYPRLQQIVNKSGVTTIRERPAQVLVRVYETVVDDNGKLGERFSADYSVMPPVVPLDSNSFNAEMDKLVGRLPPEFAAYVRAESYERGHASGYEECLGIAHGMVHDLSDVISRYTTRIQDQMMKK